MQRANQLVCAQLKIRNKGNSIHEEQEHIQLQCSGISPNELWILLHGILTKLLLANVRNSGTTPQKNHYKKCTLKQLKVRPLFLNLNWLKVVNNIEFKLKSILVTLNT